MSQVFRTGQRVRIRREWTNSDEEGKTVFVIVGPTVDDRGPIPRVDIAPETWTHGRFRPIEKVEVDWIEAVD